MEDHYPQRKASKLWANWSKTEHNWLKILPPVSLDHYLYTIQLPRGEDPYTQNDSSTIVYTIHNIHDMIYNNTALKFTVDETHWVYKLEVEIYYELNLVAERDARKSNGPGVRMLSNKPTINIHVFSSLLKDSISSNLYISYCYNRVE